MNIYYFFEKSFDIQLKNKLISDYCETEQTLTDKFVELVANGTYACFCKSIVSYNIYRLLNLNNDNNVDNESLKNLFIKYEKYLYFDYSTFECYVMLLFYNRIKARNRTLRKRIENMFSNYENLVFLTLTFTDDVLNNTSNETRRKYVQRYMKENVDVYVANIDFGFDDKFTKREHYHAVATDIVDLSGWHYGIINVKRINNKNAGALTHYINKLTNHAFKLSTRLNVRLIYSRNKI